MRGRGGVVVFLVLLALPSEAGTVALKRKFVDAFKDQATITAEMTIHHAHASPNQVGTGSADGDLHFSGESDDIGLPFVAEIINARQPGQKQALDQVHANATNGKVRITGAWRLWFEHPAKNQTQGANSPFLPDNTNPDHSFEVHPISGVDTVSILGSFIPVVGFTAYAGTLAFPYFDSISLTAKASATGIVLETPKAKYNYVDFFIELTQDPKKVSDGFIALAEVQDKDGAEVSNQERRMIFVKDTDAAKKVSKCSAGSRLHVMGIPRINLNAVSFLAQQNGTKQFKTQLPYEMIIIGAFGGNDCAP